MPQPPPQWTRRDVDAHWEYAHEAMSAEIMALKADRNPHIRAAAIVQRIAERFGEIDRYDVEVVVESGNWNAREYGLIRLTDGWWIPGLRRMPDDIKKKRLPGSASPQSRKRRAELREKLIRQLVANPWADAQLSAKEAKPPLVSRQKTARPHTPKAGVVYLIRAHGTSRTKIGRSISAQVRFDSLRTASPFPLELLRAIHTSDCIALERTLHERYAAYRQHGEWFDLPTDVLDNLLREDFIL